MIKLRHHTPAACPALLHGSGLSERGFALALTKAPRRAAHVHCPSYSVNSRLRIASHIVLIRIHTRIANFAYTRAWVLVLGLDW